MYSESNVLRRENRLTLSTPGQLSNTMNKYVIWTDMYFSAYANHLKSFLTINQMTYLHSYSLRILMADIYVHFFLLHIHRIFFTFHHYIYISEGSILKRECAPVQTLVNLHFQLAYKITTSSGRICKRAPYIPISFAIQFNFRLIRIITYIALGSDVKVSAESQMQPSLCSGVRSSRIFNILQWICRS